MAEVYSAGEGRSSQTKGEVNVKFGEESKIEAIAFLSTFSKK